MAGMRWGSPVLNLLIIAALAGLIFAAPDTRENDFSGTVEWVSDGDTIRISGHKWPIRLWGIDAPERDTPEGKAAQSFARTAWNNRAVTCTKRAVDKYRRTVASCRLGEDDLSQAILAAGHATEMCRFTGGALGHCK